MKKKERIILERERTFKQKKISFHHKKDKKELFKLIKEYR